MAGSAASFDGENMDEITIRESAKAAKAIAKTAGKAVDAGREVGSWLNRVFGRAIVNTVDLYWTDRVVARRIEAAIYDWKTLRRLFSDTSAELEKMEAKRTHSLPPKLAIPLIESATIETEKHLQKLWARLLATALTRKDHVTKTYVTILSELTSADAKALKQLYKDWLVLDKKKWRDGYLGSTISYEPGIDAPSGPPGLIYKLARLGIVEPARIGLLVYGDPESDGHRLSDEFSAVGDLSTVRITRFGEDFCNAVGLNATIKSRKSRQSTRL